MSDLPMIITYEFLGGPLDGQEFTFPFNLRLPPRLEYRPDFDFDPDNTKSIGHYYACTNGNPEEGNCRPAFAWRETP